MIEPAAPLVQKPSGIESPREDAEARRRRRPPVELLAIMTVAFLLCLAWTVVTPAFQAPDEGSHFAYTQFLAERFELPGDATAKIFSTQQIRATSAVNADQVAAQPLTRPEWSEQPYERWQRTSSRDVRNDGGGPHSASTYPPLGYLWQSVGYRLASGGDFFDELFGVRLFSALWLPITVLASWLLAGELFGRRRLLQLTASAVPALLPMVGFISGSVSPDGMLYALWTLALWLGVRNLRHELTVGGGAAFVAVVGIACVTKSVSYALLPGALFVVALGLWRCRSLPLARLAGLAAAPAAALALTFGAWVLLAHSLARPATGSNAAGLATAAQTNWRQLLSYVWQFYLPRIPDQTPALGTDIGYPAFRVWIIMCWGAFGWLEIKFADAVYRVLAILTAGVGVAAIVALWRARRQDLAVIAFLALVVLTLLAGLHWSDYHVLQAGTGRFMQGRYIFPLIGLMGCALAAAVSLVPTRVRGAVVGVVIGFLFVYYLFSLGLVLERFYA